MSGTRTVDLVTDDGVHLQGFRRAATGSRRGAIVVVHGFAAGGDEARVAALADTLGAHGYDVLTYDARGHGASGGEATCGEAERLDVAAATAALASGDERVVVIGASMGAVGVLRYASADGALVAGLVLVSCPARWRLPFNARGIASTMLTQTPFGRYVARQWMHVRIARGFARPAAPVDLVRSVDVPIAIIHGRGDPFISPGDADLLYEAAREPKRVTIVGDVGHAYEPEATPAILDAVEWIDTRS